MYVLKCLALLVTSRDGSPLKVSMTIPTPILIGTRYKNQTEQNEPSKSWVEGERGVGDPCEMLNEVLE